MDEKLRIKINKLCPYDQGIFTEPYGIPDSEKRLVLYTRYIESGARGGSCWGDVAKEVYFGKPDDVWKVLDIYLEKLHPNISFLKYKKIASLIQSNEKFEWEYYGNYSNYVIEYIVVDELEKLLNE